MVSRTWLFCRINATTAVQSSLLLFQITSFLTG